MTPSNDDLARILPIFRFIGGVVLPLNLHSVLNTPGVEEIEKDPRARFAPKIAPLDEVRGSNLTASRTARRR